MKRLFVTGVPGWLGSRFVELITTEQQPYRKERYTPLCLILPEAKLEDLASLDFETVEGDITDPDTLKGTMDGCDAVVHIAGLIHPKRIKDLSAINEQGTKNVLAEACRAGVRRFIYISSNSPMGFNRPPDSTFTEESPCRPYMNYGKSKYRAEQAVKEAQASGKIETVILKACWFYGPRQPARQTKFFNMIKSGKPIIFGDGSMRRSMSYVDNLVQGIVLAMEVEGAAGSSYWIADERPYTINEIYGTVADLLGVEELRPRKIPAFISSLCQCADFCLQRVGLYNQEIHVASEMARSIACSVDKAKRELGYKPEVELREGMRRSIEWCRAHGQPL